MSGLETCFAKIKDREQSMREQKDKKMFMLLFYDSQATTQDPRATFSFSLKDNQGVVNLAYIGNIKDYNKLRLELSENENIKLKAFKRNRFGAYEDFT